MIERLKPHQYWTGRGRPLETILEVGAEEREPVVVVRESELAALEAAAATPVTVDWNDAPAEATHAVVGAYIDFWDMKRGTQYRRRWLIDPENETLHILRAEVTK
jgi:hypothetical protein